MQLFLQGPSFALPAGDVNCDGRLSGNDLRVLTRSTFDPAPGCGGGDVNGDGQDAGAADLVAEAALLGAPLPRGAAITFFGLAASSGAVLSPIGELEGTPVYFRNAGVGFTVVAEGAPGISMLAPGFEIFNSDPFDPSVRPDLQVGSTVHLGDGSAEVCSEGVPAIEGPYFQPDQATADALNDFSCHAAVSNSPAFACTQNAFGNPGYVVPHSEVQFCVQATSPLRFADGETLLTARLRDTSGTLGPLRHLIVRVGPGAPPPTFSPTATPITETPSPTRTHTRTATRTLPRPSATPSPPAPTSTAATRTPTRTTPPLPTATRTRSRTPTTTGSPTPSPTTTPPVGPVVTFFGILRADDRLVPPSGTTEAGIPIFERPFGRGFSLVIEGKPGPSEVPVGRFTGVSLPNFADLQVQANRPLGAVPSEAVCDREGQDAAGVPAVPTPGFAPTPGIIAAVNDLSCRFLDGGGAPFGRDAPDACVQFDSGQFGFVNAETTIQFCGFVNTPFEFPVGDTLLTARLRDNAGNAGSWEQIVVRVQP